MTNESTQQRQHTLNVVQAYHQAWRDRDIEKILACFHDQIEYHDFFQNRVFTQSTIAQYIADSLPVHGQGELEHLAPIRADGDTAFLEYRIRLQNQQAVSAFRASEFISVKDHKIIRVHEYATLVKNESLQDHAKVEFSEHTALSRLGLSTRQIANMSQDVQDYCQQASVLAQANLNLQQVSDATGYSRNQLSFLFNQVLGSRFLQYINEQRINLVVDRLSQFSNSQVLPAMETLAFDAGFNSVSVFYKYFRQVKGASPKAYIKTTLSG